MRNNYKIWIILSLIIIFIAGVVSGVLFEDHILERKRRGSVHFPSLEIMAQELTLSLEQQSEIKELFKSNEERFHTLRKEVHKSLAGIRTQMISDIKSVLDDNQNKKFEAMIKKYKAQRQKEHEERKKRSEQSHQNKREKE